MKRYRCTFEVIDEDCHFCSITYHIWATDQEDAHAKVFDMGFTADYEGQQLSCVEIIEEVME